MIEDPNATDRLWLHFHKYEKRCDKFAQVDADRINPRPIRFFFGSTEAPDAVRFPVPSKSWVRSTSTRTAPRSTRTSTPVNNKAYVLFFESPIGVGYSFLEGTPNWETLKSEQCCGKATGKNFDECDFYNNAFDTKNWLDFTAKDNTCGKILADVIKPPSSMDQYNYYEDCYDRDEQFVFKEDRSRFHQGKRDSLLAAKARYHNTAVSIYPVSPPTVIAPFHSVIDYNSTDFEFGFPCWQEDAVSSYFNKPEVQKAFHIDYANISSFHDCNTPMYNKYVVKYKETSNFFKNMFANVQKANLQNFRVLVYNGDVDTVCNFIGDAKFVSKITTEAKFTENSRQKWTFRGKTGGFVQHYSGSLSIDVLTIKGAGHMVPMDRPGPALQMINAFMSGANYSNDLGVNMIPTPIPLNP